MTEMDQLLIRIGKIERSNKRLRALLGIAALAAILLLFLGTASTPPSVLEAQRFVLKDPAGHERGSLFATDKSWGLILYNGDASKGAALVISTVGNSMLINDHKGTPRIAAYASDDQSNFMISDIETHKSKIELKNNPQGSALTFRDGNGTDRVGMGFSAAGGVVLFNDANSTTRTVLDENVGLITFDPKGSFAWGVGFDKCSKEEQEAMRKIMENSFQTSPKPR
jgi:hypothetical protein